MKNISRSLIAATATVALLALAGCSDDATPEPTPTDTPTATGTNTPVDPTEDPSEGEDPTSVPTPTISADPETGQFEWCKPEDQKPFTGAAAKKFGPEKVMNAYCTMVDMQMENSFLDSLWRQSDGFVAQDFDAVREALGQNARDGWDQSVAALVAGTASDDDRAQLRGLVMFDLAQGSDLTLDEPAIYNQRFSPARTWVDTKEGSPRLGMDFTVGADAALLGADGKTRLAYEYEKTITYWLTPGRKGGEREWYIDGYEYTTAGNKPVPREDLIEETPGS